MPQPPSIGLVLSGGGARGAAHIGVVHALKEAGVQVTHYAGTSAGALMGVMAAAGCSTEDMLSFWMDSAPFRTRHFGLRTTGLLNSTTYVDTLKKYVRYETFEELPHHFTVAVTAMVEGKTKYISQGPLWPITLASAAYPFVFSPIEIDGEVYMDGGILDNLPVGALRDKCDLLVGVNISPQRTYSSDDLATARGIVERIMDLHFTVRAEDTQDDLDVLIAPPYLSAYGLFDTKNTIKIYQHGLEAAQDAIPAIEDRIAALGH